MHRILVADDQVPDPKLRSEKEVLDHYTALYKDPKFAAGFVFMFRLLNLLGDSGYKVVSARTPSDVRRLTSGQTYSAIVLDLGWWTTKMMGFEEKMRLGFPLAEEIKKSCGGPILMFSSRFLEKEELAKTAAEAGCLPVYKSYDDECAKHLLVTLRWAVLRGSSAFSPGDERKVIALNMYRRLSNVLLYTVVASAALLLLAVALVILRHDRATLITSVFGFVSTFMNGAIYGFVSKYRKDMR
jgi:CheY-like chemotaxis protein